MYIDIERAQACGLDISLTDKGRKLSIQPIDSIEVKALRDMETELREHGMKRNVVDQIIDDAGLAIHQASIWTRLAEIDESQP